MRVKATLKIQPIEAPSSGYGNSGTHFKTCAAAQLTSQPSAFISSGIWSFVAFETRRPTLASQQGWSVLSATLIGNLRMQLEALSEIKAGTERTLMQNSNQFHKDQLQGDTNG